MEDGCNEMDNFPGGVYWSVIENITVVLKDIDSRNAATAQKENR